MARKNIHLKGNLYWQKIADIENARSESEYTEIKSDIRQGHILSPQANNISTYFIIRESNDVIGINIGVKNLNGTSYANNTALVAGMKTTLIRTVQKEVLI